VKTRWQYFNHATQRITDCKRVLPCMFLHAFAERIKPPKLVSAFQAKVLGVAKGVCGFASHVAQLDALVNESSGQAVHPLGRAPDDDPDEELNRKKIACFYKRGMLALANIHFWRMLLAINAYFAVLCHAANIIKAASKLGANPIALTRFSTLCGSVMKEIYRFKDLSSDVFTENSTTRDVTMPVGLGLLTAAHIWVRFVRIFDVSLLSLLESDEEQRKYISSLWVDGNPLPESFSNDLKRLVPDDIKHCSETGEIRRRK